MANRLVENPFVLDSANNTDVLINRPFRIDGMEWINPANTADEVEVTDRNGKLIWGTTAAADNAGSISAGFAPGWVDGLKLTKLESGKLVIYFG